MNDIKYIFLTGMGYDVHKLQPSNDGVILCDTHIPCQFSIEAHSDGDVAIHALVDAILGALAEGDIGEHFPPTDSRWAGAASSQFLKHALAICTEKRASLVNIDITIICEQPKISPHKTILRTSIAKLTNLPLHRVSVKATTTEKLGFLGRGEGIAAQAVVSIKVPEE